MDEKYDRASSALSDLRKRVLQLEREKQDFESRANAAERSKEDLESRLSDIEDELTRERTQREQAEKERQLSDHKLKSKETTFEREKAELETQVAQINQESKNNKSEIDKLRRKLSEEKESLMKDKEEFQDQQRASWMKQINELNDRYTRERQELESEYERERSVNRQRIDGQIQQREKQYNANLNQLQMTIQQLEEEIKKKDQQYERQKQAAVDDNEQRFENMKKKMEYENQIKIEEIQHDHQQQIIQLEGQRDSIEHQLLDMRQVFNNELEARQVEARKRDEIANQVLQSAISDKEKEYQRIIIDKDEEIQDLQEEIQSVSKSKDLNIHRLENEIERLKKAFNEQQEQNEQNEEQNQILLQKQREECEFRISQLQQLHQDELNSVIADGEKKILFQQQAARQIVESLQKRINQFQEQTVAIQNQSQQINSEQQNKIEQILKDRQNIERQFSLLSEPISILFIQVQAKIQNFLREFFSTESEDINLFRSPIQGSQHLSPIIQTRFISPESKYQMKQQQQYISNQSRSVSPIVISPSIPKKTIERKLASIKDDADKWIHTINNQFEQRMNDLNYYQQQMIGNSSSISSRKLKSNNQNIDLSQSQSEYRSPQHVQTNQYKRTIINQVDIQPSIQNIRSPINKREQISSSSSSLSSQFTSPQLYQNNNNNNLYSSFISTPLNKGNETSSFSQQNTFSSNQNSMYDDIFNSLSQLFTRLSETLNELFTSIISKDSIRTRALKHRNEQIMQISSSLTSQIEQLKQQLKIQEQISEDQKTKQRQIIEAKNKEIIDLKDKMNENIENLRSIQTRLKEKSDQLETLQEDKKEISKEIVKMKETINNKIEVHTIVEDNSKILTVKIVELESSIAQISLDKKQLVEQIENDRELIQQQEESIKKLKEEKIRWKGKYELKEEEIWNIEQELASLHGLKSKVIECESLQKQLSEMKQKIQSQKRENDESKRNHIEATRQLEEKENEIKRLKEIDRQQQKNISDTETKMKSQYRSATSEREDLEKKLSVSADKLRSSERMIDQLKEQCGVYERELKRLQSPMKVSVNPNIISPFQF